MLNKFMRDPGKTAVPALAEGEPPTSVLRDVDKNGGDARRPAEEAKAAGQELIDAKVRLHRKLIDDLNLASLERMSKEDLRRQIGDLVAEYVKTERLLLNSRELENFSQEVF